MIKAFILLALFVIMNRRGRRKYPISSYFLVIVVVSMISISLGGFEQAYSNSIIHVVSATSEGDGGDNGGGDNGDNTSNEGKDAGIQPEDDVTPEMADQPESIKPPEQQPISEICNNGIDDDGDGKTDSDDSDCADTKELKGFTCIPPLACPVIPTSPPPIGPGLEEQTPLPLDEGQTVKFSDLIPRDDTTNSPIQPTQINPDNHGGGGTPLAHQLPKQTDSTGTGSGSTTEGTPLPGFDPMTVGTKEFQSDPNAPETSPGLELPSQDGSLPGQIDPGLLTPNEAPIVSELGYETNCEDQIDNDKDGATDKADSDCLSAAELGALNPVNPSPVPSPPSSPFSAGDEVYEVCNDGKDNDGDGAIDMQDADCAGMVKVPPWKICWHPPKCPYEGPLMNDANPTGS